MLNVSKLHFWQKHELSSDLKNNGLNSIVDVALEFFLKEKQLSNTNANNVTQIPTTPTSDKTDVSDLFDNAFQNTESDIDENNLFILVHLSNIKY